MMSERLNLTVDDGIGEMLAELAGSRNKMGEAVSNLVRAASTAEQIPAASAVEELRLMIMGLTSKIKMMERQISKAHHLAVSLTMHNHERIYRLMEELDLATDARSRVDEISVEDHVIADFGGIDDPFTGATYFD